MKTTANSKLDVKNVKLTNYKEFVEVIKNETMQERERKIQETLEYIEYIKEHDEEAYKKYLSYSTYLETCI